MNKEQNYPHSFHLFPVSQIKFVNVLGDVQLSYIGFGSKGSVPIIRSKLAVQVFYPWLHLDNLSDLEPAPPVSFNLTFMCPDGEVRHSINSFEEGIQNIVKSSDAEKYSDLPIPGKIQIC